MGLPWCLKLEVVIVEKENSVRVCSSWDSDREQKIKVYRMRNFPPLCKLRATRDLELLIETRKEILQKLIRGLIVLNTKAAEDVRKIVLQSAPETLYAALGFGRQGKDDFYLQSSANIVKMCVTVFLILKALF